MHTPFSTGDSRSLGGGSSRSSGSSRRRGGGFAGSSNIGLPLRPGGLRVPEPLAQPAAATSVGSSSSSSSDAAAIIMLQRNDGFGEEGLEAGKLEQESEGAVQASKKARTDELGTARITSAPPIFAMAEKSDRLAGLPSIELPPLVPRFRKTSGAASSAAAGSVDAGGGKARAKVRVVVPIIIEANH